MATLSPFRLTLLLAIFLFPDATYCFSPQLKHYGRLTRVKQVQPLHQPLGSLFVPSATDGKSLTSLHGWGNPFSDVVDLATSLFRYEGSVPLSQAFGLNVVLFVALQKKLFEMLTPAGFFHSMALGTGLWASLGWRGWTLCVMYLFLGQAVTKVKFEEKEEKGIAEKRGGRRGPENVWGSALAGLICAICAAQGDAFLGIPSSLYCLGYVAAIATKLADTFASEIGKAYGKTTFLITTFEPVEPGTEGAVSLEGTAASIVGGLLLALYGYIVSLVNLPGVAIVTVAAFIATNFESVLGATLQDKEGLEWMTNEVVNFFNTLVGAILAIIAGAVFL
jgi:uncharacterized protein (TIGR00297 family)